MYICIYLLLGFVVWGISLICLVVIVILYILDNSFCSPYTSCSTSFPFLISLFYLLIHHIIKTFIYIYIYIGPLVIYTRVSLGGFLDPYPNNN
ncbi:hypothetical protein J3Q64DRAFT_1758382 [Phycomyces blakesleeanus]|uniref:Uncharacterized protein n=1 Tax=Phycomyces blakesleeanus TaxID=4837 RepID=A0ABR3ASM9_PHYBL